MTNQKPEDIITRSASMKVPPKRKGNASYGAPPPPTLKGLNESPSEKEGKFCHTSCIK